MESRLDTSKLIPLESRVQHVASKSEGQIVAYNDNYTDCYRPPAVYPYVVRWDNGHEDVYNQRDFIVLALPESDE